MNAQCAEGALEAMHQVIHEREATEHIQDNHYRALENFYDPCI